MEPSAGSSSQGATALGAAMAAMTITDKVHYDALYDVCSFLDVPDLRNLRLVNRTFGRAASRHLFRTLVIRPRRQIIATIVKVSKNEVFASGVCEIIWETAERHDPLRPLEDFDSSESQGWLDRGLRASVAAATDLDEIPAVDRDVMSSREWLIELTAAFKEFTGLKTLTLCSWARRMSTLKALWEKDNVRLEQDDCGPDRLPKFYNRHGEAEAQTQALCHILSALGAAKRSITELYLNPTLDDRVAKKLCDREQAGHYDVVNQHMLVFWHELNETVLLELVQPLQNLECVFMTFQSWPQEIWNSLCNGGLAHFLSKLPRLEQLSISLRIVFKELAAARPEDPYGVREVMHFGSVARIPLDKVFRTGHVFPRLRVLDLDSFVSEGRGLAEVIARHPTLEYLSLHSIILFGTFDPAAWAPGKPSYNRLQKPLKQRHDGSSASANQRSSDDTSTPAGSADDSGAVTSADDDTQWSQPHWDLVVKKCQQLSELDGVNFGKPSEFFFDEEGLALKQEIYPDSTARALEEAAMNGRPNKSF